MPTLRLSEPVIDAAIAKLRANMPGRVAEKNLTFDDDITCTPPQDSDFYPFGVSPLPRAPAIVVTDGGSPQGPGFVGEGHSFEYRLMLAVFVYEEDSDRERLGRKLLRQTAAAIESLWLDAPIQELIIDANTDRPWITPEREIPGPVFSPTNETSFWRSYRTVVFHVSKREN